jgi:hypothetical protein
MGRLRRNEGANVLVVASPRHRMQASQPNGEGQFQRATPLRWNWSRAFQTTSTRLDATRSAWVSSAMPSFGRAITVLLRLAVADGGNSAHGWRAAHKQANARGEEFTARAARAVSATQILRRDWWRNRETLSHSARAADEYRTIGPKEPTRQAAMFRTERTHAGRRHLACAKAGAGTV